MKYLPLSQDGRREILETIGVESVETLFESIPAELRLNRELAVPSRKSELEIRRYFDGLARENKAFQSYFLGAGTYYHFYPVIIDYLTARQEFLTSYTPYQPEVSQGTLQYLFEYQTMMADLTGLEVSNASMYDGATATAEAVLMALRLQRKRRRVLVSEGIHPHYHQVIETYLSNLDFIIETLPVDDDRTNPETLAAHLGDDVAAVVIGYPNFFGVVEPLAELAAKAEASGALTISVTSEALSLALLKPPGACGAAIAVGEAQSFGVSPQFGGPHLGFFTCRDKDKRQMPGRVCGLTKDRNGVRGFVLTLNTREQHIRREKATSNICSNQGLCALRATIFLSALGKHGIREMAVANHAKATYLKQLLKSIAGVKVSNAKHFNEFVVTLPKNADHVVHTMAGHGIMAGLDLGRFADKRADQLLVTVTELNTREEMDEFGRILGGLL